MSASRPASRRLGAPRTQRDRDVDVVQRARGGSGSARPAGASAARSLGSTLGEGLHRVAEALVGDAQVVQRLGVVERRRAAGARPRAARRSTARRANFVTRLSRDGLTRKATSASSSAAPAIELALAELATERARGGAARDAGARRSTPATSTPGGAGRRRPPSSEARSSRSTSSSRSAPGRALNVAQRAPHLVGVEAAEDRAAHLEQRARATERDAEVVHGLVVGRREHARDASRRAASSKAQSLATRNGPAMPGRPVASAGSARRAHRCDPHEARGASRGLNPSALRERAPHGEARRLRESARRRAAAPARRRPSSSSSAARACLRAASRSSRVGVLVDHAARGDRDLAREPPRCVERDRDVHGALRRERRSLRDAPGRAARARAMTCTRPDVDAPRLAQPAARRASPTSPFSSTVTLGHAELARELGVAQEVVQRPVDRHERARLHELDHAPLLLAVRVAAHVDGAVRPPGAELDAAPQEVVHHAHHLGLVARDDPARHDDHVARARGRAPGARRARAARAPRPAPPATPSPRARIARFGQLARALRGRRRGRRGHSRYGRPAWSPVDRAVACATRACVDDAAPERHDLAPVAPRDLAEHAQAMHVRREHRDDDRLLRAGDDRLERARRRPPRCPSGRWRRCSSSR